VKSKRRPLAALAMFVTLSWGPAVHAGPYSDDLAKCMVAKTTEADRVAFVQWMFTAAALHPAVKPLATVTPEQIETANKRTAELFTTLLTDSCGKESVAVVKYEGTAAFQSSFQVLGQIAGTELFAHPAVAAGMADLEKHFDKEKLEAVFSKKD
jgi:hypothetical protein